VYNVYQYVHCIKPNIEKDTVLTVIFQVHLGYQLLLYSQSPMTLILSILSGHGTTLHILSNTVSPALLRISLSTTSTLNVQHHTLLDPVSVIFTFNMSKPHAAANMFQKPKMQLSTYVQSHKNDHITVLYVLHLQLYLRLENVKMRTKGVRPGAGEVS